MVKWRRESEIDLRVNTVSTRSSIAFWTRQANRKLSVARPPSKQRGCTNLGTGFLEKSQSLLFFYNFFPINSSFGFLLLFWCWTCFGVVQGGPTGCSYSFGSGEGPRFMIWDWGGLVVVARAGLKDGSLGRRGWGVGVEIDYGWKIALWTFGRIIS